MFRNRKELLTDLGTATPYAIVVTGIATTVWCLVRNEAFGDPVFAHAIRVFLAIAAGVAVRIIPGTLQIQLSPTGQQLNATGALAFAVLTYFTAPQLSASLDPDAIPVPAPPIITMRAWGVTDFSNLDAYEFGEPASYKNSWIAWSLRKARRQAAVSPYRVGPTVNPVGTTADPAALNSRIASSAPTESFFLAESFPFQRAYESFSAKIVAPPDGPRVDQRHEFVAFRIRPFQSSYTFQPIPVFREANSGHVIQVPEIQRGDLILLFADLFLRDGVSSNTSGRSIAIHLVTY